ncbi:hypothetical protein MPSEU_000122500 [Mayamaea pseudoterrestris]|nr:hypothetical protein MPSEU_000122500 [Mayamaea pseudoterrestris]
MTVNERNNVNDETNIRQETAPEVHIRRHATQVAMETLSYKSIVNSVTAGYVAGVCGTVIGHPFDSAKVWLQTKDYSVVGTTRSVSSSNATAANVASAASPATSISSNNNTFQFTTLRQYATKSLDYTRALYRGVSGPLLTVGLVQSVNFAVYDASRRMLYGLDYPDQASSGKSLDYLHHDSLTNVAMASAFSGSVLSLFTLPMITIKTQQQVRNVSLRQALTELSWRQARRAMLPHVATETGGRAIYFGTYEGLKRYLLAYQQQQSALQQLPSSTFHHDTSFTLHNVKHDTKISLQQRMLCAAASGLTCWTVIFPLDVLRSRLLAGHDATAHVSAWQATKDLYKQSGVRGFYRGFSVTVLRAGPVAAVVLPIYDVALEALSAWNV